MHWLRGVWDGPFRTPPLAQPITVGWVVLKLFETLWRLLLIACILIGLAIVGIWISSLNPLASQISIKVSRENRSDCLAKGWLIHVDIENRSRKTVGEVHLQLRVYPQGKSEDVALYLSANHDLHDIIRPGEALSYCMAMPELEAGSIGPYTIGADVTYAEALAKGIPVPVPPPPIQVIDAPPPLVRSSGNSN